MSFPQVLPSSEVIGGLVLTNFMLHYSNTYSFRRCIAKDPDVYPDPDTFKPDRWLDENGQLKEDSPFWNFGFGRRYEHLVEQYSRLFSDNMFLPEYAQDNMWRTSQ